MADRDRSTPDSSPNQAPEDMHWGINYLREDLQDIRLDIREIRVEMQARFTEVQGQFGDVQGRFGDVQSRFGDVQSQFGEMQRQFGEMQKQADSHFFWTLGFMATLFAINAAYMTALIKL